MRPLRSTDVLFAALTTCIAGSAAAEPDAVRRSRNAVRLEGNFGVAYDPELKGMPSTSGIAGVDFGPLQTALVLEWNSLLTENLAFAGAGVGPVFRFPSGLRLDFLAVGGASNYSGVRCGFSCSGGAEYTAFTVQGRAGVGFVFGPKRRALGLVTAWLSGGYTPVETVEYTTSTRPWLSLFGEPEPTLEHGTVELGGFRGGGGLGLGVLLPM